MKSTKDKSANVKNEFSWSKSRDNVFKACRRMYYLNYYAYWGGWNQTATPQQQQLYTMRNLKTRSLLLGDDIHETIAWIIRRLKTHNRPVDLKDALKKIRYDLLTDWLFSMKHYYFTWPKETPGLTNHYYKQELDLRSFEEDCSHAESCIRNFYATEIYRSLMQKISAELIIEARDSTQVADTKIWIQSDLIVRYESGNIEIVDWKTGKDTDSDEIQIQLGIYALYARERWHIEPERIRVREVNLYTCNEASYVIDSERIAETIRYVRNSITEMRKLLANPQRNLALPEEFFAMSSDSRYCPHCKFRGACQQEEHTTPNNIPINIYLPAFEQEYKNLTDTLNLENRTT